MESTCAIKGRTYLTALIIILGVGSGFSAFGLLYVINPSAFLTLFGGNDFSYNSVVFSINSSNVIAYPNGTWAEPGWNVSRAELTYASFDKEAFDKVTNFTDIDNQTYLAGMVRATTVLFGLTIYNDQGWTIPFRMEWLQPDFTTSVLSGLYLRFNMPNLWWQQARIDSFITRAFLNESGLQTESLIVKNMDTIIINISKISIKHDDPWNIDNITLTINDLEYTLASD